MIFLITFVILFISFIFLGVGYFLTGKSKLKKKCGTVPNCKKGKCDLCEKEDKE